MQFRENVAAWVCFYDRKDVFKGFLERVLRLKEVSFILIDLLHMPCLLGIDPMIILAERLSFFIFIIQFWFLSVGDYIYFNYNFFSQ